MVGRSRTPAEPARYTPGKGGANPVHPGIGYGRSNYLALALASGEPAHFSFYHMLLAN